MLTRYSLLAGCLSLCAVVAHAGPLNPPSGPVAPTPRFGPRIELSQETTPSAGNIIYRITQPGSYYLAEDLVVPFQANGIRIDTSGVTLDLNGFTIRGDPGSFNAISINNLSQNIVIHSGLIRDMGSSAIATSDADRCWVENILVSNIGIVGIDLDEFCTIRNCVVDGAVVAGIRAGRGAVIESCLVRNMTDGDGYVVGAASRLIGCVAESVAGDGFGIEGDGFIALSDSLLHGCLAVMNSGDGFDLGDRCVMVECAATLNDGNGANLGESSRIERCHFADLLGGGISVDERSSVRQCSVVRAGGQGIFLGSNSQAIGNTVTDCTGAGFSGIVVFANESGCMIDSNYLTGNTTNMNVFGTGCTVIRNFSHAGVINGINIAPGNFNEPTISLPSGGFGVNPWANIDN